MAIVESPSVRWLRMDGSSGCDRNIVVDRWYALQVCVYGPNVLFGHPILEREVGLDPHRPAVPSEIRAEPDGFKELLFGEFESGRWVWGEVS